MTAPKRKGYRAALTYAVELDGPAQLAVITFLSWFYDRPISQITDEVQRTARASDLAYAAAVVHPTEGVTAAARAGQYLDSTRSRAHAMREIEQMLKMCEPAAAPFWSAVRLLVHDALRWRVTP